MHDIPALRLSVLTKLIKRFQVAPNLLLMKLFGQDKFPSDQIEWEAEVGSRGMTPFANEDAPAPRLSPLGISQHAEKAAFWKEKMFFGASFLNNIRTPGTRELYQAAKKTLAKGNLRMRHRCDRSKEWMFAKMLTAGKFDYIDPQGHRVSVDYGVPAEHNVTLGSTDKWTHADSNPVEDIMDSNLYMQNANGAKLDYSIFTSEVLKVLVMNSKIQALLAKSQYGQGDLFARPLQVLGDLLNIPNMVLYDEMYQVKGWLTAAVSAGSDTYTLSVDDATDFEVGATAFINGIKTKKKEALTITAVNPIAGTVGVTVASGGNLLNSYAAQDDCLTMTRKFIDPTKFCMFCSEIEGQKVAEFMQSPFGLDRHYGMKPHSWTVEDPDGVFIRIENKGLPVLYFEDATYNLTVR